MLHPANDYVEAFVKDVNRARALTVEAVMQPPACRITDSSIEAALKQMRQANSDYGYYVSQKQYQGMLTEQALSEALASKKVTKISCQIWQDVPAISPDTPLEQALSDTLEAEFSVPVIDEDGILQGEISRKNLAEVLSEPTSKDNAA